MKNPAFFSIRPPRGKLAVLLPGMGAVATTFVAGVFLSRKGLATPVGSLTQLGSIRMGEDTNPRPRKLKNFAGLAQMEDLTFGGWDIFPESALEVARHAHVLDARHIAQVEDELAEVKPMKGAFSPEYVKRLHGTHLKRGGKKELVESLREDIRSFLDESGAERGVAIWCGSTEVYLPPEAVHETVDSFERGLRENHPAITPSQLYAWACVLEGVPFANGSPNFAVDFPALIDLARQRQVPLAGKDFKTGQTFVKTVLAPGLKHRALGLNGWFSTNILGNRDGEVLADPDSFRSKEVSKLSVLESILSPEDNPELYGAIDHRVSINYYPPRGDEKEGWDSIDLFGWLGYPMQLKVNFMCRDSILAAPIVLDLALLLDLAARSGFAGIQEWLAFYWKSPMTSPGARLEHDLFVQASKLEDTLRVMMRQAVLAPLAHEA